MFGLENVYPLYVSAPNKTSCFHVLINELKDLKTGINGLRLSSLIPPALSLDVSLVNLYNVVNIQQLLFSNQSNPYLHKNLYNNSLYGMELTSTNCNFNFMVTYGIGVRGWGLSNWTMSLAVQVTIIHLLIR